MTPSEMANLLHTALHATRDAIQTIQDDEQVTPENLFAARDCLRVAVLTAKRGPHDEAVDAARRALQVPDVASAEVHVEDTLRELHASGPPCDLGGDRRLPPRIELFANVEQRIQGIVMKHQRQERFVFVPVVIISFPEYPARRTTVYGVFSVDAWAIQQGKPCFVKQDFLVSQRDGGVRYYGGGEGSESIEAFCERFGAPHYGCEQRDGLWRCADHWYCDEADRRARVPRETEFRQALDRAIAIAHEHAPQARR